MLVNEYRLEIQFKKVRKVWNINGRVPTIGMLACAERIRRTDFTSPLIVLISWVSLKNYNFWSHDTLRDCQFASTYFKIIATIRLIINVAVPWGMYLKFIQSASNMSSTLSLIFPGSLIFPRKKQWWNNFQLWFSLRNVLILVLKYHEILGSYHSDLMRFDKVKYIVLLQLSRVNTSNWLVVSLW
jgi:hypothetical protein